MEMPMDRHPPSARQIPPADLVGCSQQRSLERGDIPVPGGLYQDTALAGTSEQGEPGRLAHCAERTAVLRRAETHARDDGPTDLMPRC